MLPSPRPRKKCAHVRERNSRLVFSESDMAERKRNSTGREVLPAKPLRVAWLCAKRRRGFDTAASNPAPRAQGEATKPAAWIAGLKPASMTISLYPDDLLYPPFTAY
jgi:hypothetical protein